METKTHRPIQAGQALARADQLAWRLAEMATGEWPPDPEVDEMVGNRIIDDAAVALAALERPAVVAARGAALAHPSGRGGSIYGLPQSTRVAVDWAAWANAVAVRELDFHDNIMAAETAHPGDAIPALVATAQHMGKTGRDLIRGIATSYEVQLRLSEHIALNPHRIDHVGHLGPAITAGIGAMLGLPAETIYHAINLSAHTSVFTRQGRKGQLSSWKAFAPAIVGRMSIAAIDRAMRGEAGPSPVWEGDYGIFSILLDGPDAAYDVRLPVSGEPRRGILSTFTKEHSAGYHGNSLIDLAIRLRGRLPDLGAVEEIELHSKTYTHVVMGSGSGDPEKYDPGASRETLDHSAMYIFAVALEDGCWHHETSYAEARRNRPETVTLWGRIRTVESPDWNRRYYDEPDPLRKAQGARAVVRLSSGQIVEEELAFADAHPLGAVPFGRKEYLCKFSHLTEGMFQGGQRGAFLTAVEGLPDLSAGALANLVPVTGHIDAKGLAEDAAGLF